jgi:hypothetical protein
VSRINQIQETDGMERPKAKANNCSAFRKDWEGCDYVVRDELDCNVRVAEKFI